MNGKSKELTVWRGVSSIKMNEILDELESPEDATENMLIQRNCD